MYTGEYVIQSKKIPGYLVIKMFSLSVHEFSFMMAAGAVCFRLSVILCSTIIILSNYTQCDVLAATVQTRTLKVCRRSKAIHSSSTVPAPWNRSTAAGASRRPDVSTLSISTTWTSKTSPRYSPRYASGSPTLW